jgi:PAS domain S-box-containing protein
MTTHDEQAFYRTLVEEMPALICRFLPDGTLVYVNRAYQECFSPNGQTLVGKNFFAFIPEPDHREVKRRYLSLTAASPVVTYEHPVNRPDGSVGWQEWTDRAVFDERGRILEYQSIGRDVTGRRAAEHGLARSEERYRQFFETNIAATYITRPDGSLVACNQAFIRLFGFRSLEEAMGTNVLALYSDVQDRAQFLGLLKAKRHLASYESRFRRRDGQVIDVLENVTGAFDAAGDLVEVFGFMVDHTEAKKTLQRLLQAQKMDAVGALAGGIAHDFNNLLMCIQGNAAVMLHAAPRPDADRELLDIILRSTATGARLTRQLLSLARSGRYEPVPVDLNAVVLKSGKLFEASHRGIRVVYRFEDGVLPVEVDETRIEQALLNLFLNSANAMPSGGNLTLETRRIELDPNSGGAPGTDPAAAEIVVADDGCGIEAEILPQVFEPFFTTRKPGAGTGLGLTSACGIIHHHGGTIGITSTKGRGTTVTVRLPVTAKPVVPRSEPAEGAAESRRPHGPGLRREGFTVLLIDDDTGVLNSVARMLGQSRCRVLAAASGKSGVDIYREAGEQIQVVILDMVMPDMGGFEAFNRIRQLNPDARIVLASGYSLSEEVMEVLSSGGVEFLQKPFSEEQLWQKIEKTMGVS